MQVQIEWNRPVPLKDERSQSLIYCLDLNRLPDAAGIYILGRRFGKRFEALYVGKAKSVRRRVKIQLNNLRLTQHLRNAKLGKRILLAGKIVLKPGQRAEKGLLLAERALIRYFLSEGHDLVNMLGTRLRRHEVISSGKHPKRFIPGLIYLEKAKGG